MSGIGPAMDMAMDIARDGRATAPAAAPTSKTTDATGASHSAHVSQPAAGAGKTVPMADRAGASATARAEAGPAAAAQSGSTVTATPVGADAAATGAGAAPATPTTDATAGIAPSSSTPDTAPGAPATAHVAATVAAAPARTFATTQAAPRPAPAASPADAGSLGGTVFALLLVVGLILALGWLAKRMPGFGRGASNNGLRMVASLPIGARERVVVVEVGNTQLLLGVGPGGTRTLHTLDAPLPEAGPAQTPQFAQLLAQHFGKKA